MNVPHLRAVSSDAYQSGRAVPSLESGDGGGHDGGMEARVAKLESDLGHVRSDVADIRQDLKTLTSTAGDLREYVASIKTTLPHLPTRAELYGTALGAAALIITGLYGLTMWLAKPWIEQLVTSMSKTVGHP